jgi:hypothetical protein
MKGILSKFLIFAAGAGIGSAVTWKIVKTKYEQIAQEEIDSVKDYYRKKNEETESADESESATVFDLGKAMTEGFVDGMKNVPEKVSSVDVASYNSIIQEEGYSEDGEEEADTNGPYIIDADEFGDSYEYDTDRLVYYANDGVLTTESDDVIDDVNHIVGVDNLNKFDDEDVIFVRNDLTKCDYEITREHRFFTAVNDYDPTETI